VELWGAWLLAAAALHLGFQATVTWLVYPVLVAQGPTDEWVAMHAAHSRRVTPLVVLMYGALFPPVVVSTWHVHQGAAGWGAGVAVAGAIVAFGATAGVAAPAHGRLTHGWDDRVARRLVRADALRLVGAVLCLAGAVAAAA
jgi:hypothetical protein